MDGMSSLYHPHLGFSPTPSSAVTGQGVQDLSFLEFPLLDIRAVRTLSNQDAEELIRKLMVDAVCQHFVDQVKNADELATQLLAGSFTEAATVLSSLSSLSEFVRRQASASSTHAFLLGQNENVKEDRQGNYLLLARLVRYTQVCPHALSQVFRRIRCTQVCPCAVSQGAVQWKGSYGSIRLMWRRLEGEVI